MDNGTACDKRGGEASSTGVLPITFSCEARPRDQRGSRGQCEKEAASGSSAELSLLWHLSYVLSVVFIAPSCGSLFQSPHTEFRDVILSFYFYLCHLAVQ